MKNIRKKFQKQLNKFHDFYFGIEVEEVKKQKSLLMKKNFLLTVFGNLKLRIHSRDLK